MAIPRPFAWMIGLYSLSGVVLAVALGGVTIPLLLPYPWHKLLHVVGVIFFFGNSVIEALWMTAALRSGDSRLIRFAVRWMMWGDAWFLAGGFALAVINGVCLAAPYGGVLGPSWLVAALVLLGLTGTASMVLIPSQIAMWRLTQDGEPDAPIPDEFRRAVRRWGVVGTLTFVPMLLILWLMFHKPMLW